MPKQPPSNNHSDAEGQPLKTLVWSPAGLGLHYGGLWQTAYRMYAADVNEQFDIELVHGWEGQEDYDVFQEHHFISSRDSPLDQIKFLWKARWWLAANRHRFDIFHGLGGFHITVKPAFLAQKHGLPAVIKLAQHDDDLANKGDWKTWLGFHRRRREMVKQLSGVIAISKEIEEELISYGIPKENVVRIPNGVDADLFHPTTSNSERQKLRDERGWPQRNTILFVGGLDPRKRPHLLIEALAELRQEGHEAQVVYAGPTPDHAYHEHIQTRVSELGLNDRVTLTGFTREIAPIYRASDVFCLPSANEGMSNALLEAMASGLPSVVTPTSGSEELVEDGVNGRVISADPSALATALEPYLNDPGLRQQHGAASREKIEEGYSAQNVLSAHERLFRRVAAGQPARDPDEPPLVP